MNYMKTYGYFALIFLILVSCEKSGEKGNTKSPVNLKFDDSEVSKFTISAIMHQPPEIIEASKQYDHYLVSYVRPSDKKEFEYRVKLSPPNKVVWATISGRWRDTPQDEQITYSIEGETLTISQRFSDGSISKKEFTK